MSISKSKSRSGVDRYDSAAHLSSVSEFRLLDVGFATQSEIEGMIPDYYFSQGVDGFYPAMPVLIRGSGEPWDIGNLYLLTKLQKEAAIGGVTMKTIQGIAGHLLDYLRFLEDDQLHYLDLPDQERKRVTYRYRRTLLQHIRQREISPNTAKARINAIVNFYKGLINWKLIDESDVKNTPFDVVERVITIRDNMGFEKLMKVDSHNLAITAPKAQLSSDYINDGGHLRPLSIDEQRIMLRALAKHGSREMQLIFYLALYTGARIQTICTIRIHHVTGELDGESYLRLKVGDGTGIDTKFGKRMMLKVPCWLVRDMLVYADSPEARKRRGKSFYGDTDDNYLFLTNRGKPYYTSKQELADHQDSLISQRVNDFPFKGHEGETVRQFVRDLIKNIRLRHPDFQSFRFHDLRATYGMNLLECILDNLGKNQTAQAALITVQQCMGHKSINTTVQYLDYKHKQEWKICVQEQFEDKLFKYVVSSVNTTIGGE